MRFRLLYLAVVTLAACTPSIGDHCVLSTDCSVQGDRICDTSQPNGYCSKSCAGDDCPNKAACVLYSTAIPGCGFNDRNGRSGSRVSRSWCSARCFSNADCRTDEGYVCADPRSYPWNAIILDDVQDQLVCLVYPAEGLDGGEDAGIGTANVCKASGPDDAGVIEAGKAPMIGAGDAGDAGDADDGSATDASADAGDAGIADAADAD